jgi:outer membrane protein assembly factor BamD (BamD/ComL family)
MKMYVVLFLGLLSFFLNSCALMSSMGLNNKASWDNPKPAVSEEDTLWKKTQSLNTEEAYVDYLSKFPYGKFKYDARLQLQLIDTEAAWENAKLLNTEDAYKEFMRDYAGSKYNAQAFANITKIRQEETWNRTKSINTAAAYNDFIMRFPLSQYIQEAKTNFASLQSEEEWNRIKNFSNVTIFENYLKNFPNSKFKEQALAKIQNVNNLNSGQFATSDSPSFVAKSAGSSPNNGNSSFATPKKNDKIEKQDIGAERWFELSAKNNPEAYQTFLAEFPKHKFSAMAKKELAVLDEQAWMRTKTLNTKEAYENYQQIFPTGRYFKEAKKKSIDQEVATILAGKYQALPSMNKSESIPGAKLNEITIKNITGFNLVIIYSGPVSEKVEVKDGSTYMVRLPNGQYNITASLNSDVIGSFVGKETLTGGKYETKFFLGY